MDAISNKLLEMIDKKLICRVNEPTPWCSPMTAVVRQDKPTHPLRICIDPVRTLNPAIERPLYPIPTLEENLHRLKRVRIFTKIDALSGFHQVELDHESS